MSSRIASSPNAGLSAPNVRFTCTALAGTGKRGILTPDAQGYYRQPIGGLNIFNAAGEYYPYEPARQLFSSSGPLMRRISTGCLKSEYGHPKRLPGQNDDQFANRILTIDEKGVCAHIRKFELDFDNFKDDIGKPIVAIVAEIKPAGPYMAALEASFKNPDEDVCFSIRAFTEDAWVRSVKHRTLVEVVTWDYVNEPGIGISRKYRASALESMAEQTFTRENMVKALHHPAMPGVAMESRSAGLMSGVGLFKALRWEFDPKGIPAYLRW